MDLMFELQDTSGKIRMQYHAMLFLHEKQSSNETCMIDMRAGDGVIDEDEFASVCDSFGVNPAEARQAFTTFSCVRSHLSTFCIS